MAGLFISYVLQYLSMITACYYLWHESYWAFLGFGIGAHLPTFVLMKLDRISSRFNDECQACAPRSTTWAFTIAVAIFITALFARRTLGPLLNETLLAAYLLLALTCAIRDIFLFRYCKKNWEDRRK